MSALQQLFTRKMLICIFTGFASGLPLYLLLNLVPAWLRSEQVQLMGSRQLKKLMGSTLNFRN